VGTNLRSMALSRSIGASAVYNFSLHLLQADDKVTQSYIQPVCKVVSVCTATQWRLLWKENCG
jgi:hypothetical protein